MKRQKETIKTQDLLVLTNDQKRVFNMLIDFIQSKTAKAFILCGYAGTGKTTMMRYFHQ